MITKKVLAQVYEILKRVPMKGRFEYEQCGSDPTDLVYRWTIYGFDKKKIELTLFYTDMDEVIQFMKERAMKNETN